MMAGSVITVLPVLLLFLALQRHYMEGLLAGQRQGMKALLLALLLALATRWHRRWAQDEVLDDFADPAAWTALGQRRRQGARFARLADRTAAPCASTSTSAAVTGYVSARRPLPIDYPGALRVHR